MEVEVLASGRCLLGHPVGSGAAPEGDAGDAETTTTEAPGFAAAPDVTPRKGRARKPFIEAKQAEAIAFEVPRSIQTAPTPTPRDLKRRSAPKPQIAPTPPKLQAPAPATPAPSPAPAAETTARDSSVEASDATPETPAQPSAEAASGPADAGAGGVVAAHDIDDDALPVFKMPKISRPWAPVEPDGPSGPIGEQSTSAPSVSTLTVEAPPAAVPDARAGREQSSRPSRFGPRRSAPPPPADAHAETAASTQQPAPPGPRAAPSIEAALRELLTRADEEEPVEEKRKLRFSFFRGGREGGSIGDAVNAVAPAPTPPAQPATPPPPPFSHQKAAPTAPAPGRALAPAPRPDAARSAPPKQPGKTFDDSPRTTARRGRGQESSETKRDERFADINAGAPATSVPAPSSARRGRRTDSPARNRSEALSGEAPVISYAPPERPVMESRRRTIATPRNTVAWGLAVAAIFLAFVALIVLGSRLVSPARTGSNDPPPRKIALTDVPGYSVRPDPQTESRLRAELAAQRSVPRQLSAATVLDKDGDIVALYEGIIFKTAVAPTSRELDDFINLFAQGAGITGQAFAQRPLGKRNVWSGLLPQGQAILVFRGTEVVIVITADIGAAGDSVADAVLTGAGV